MTSNKRKSSRFDRRSATRKRQRVTAFVGPKHAPVEQCENALIEEVGRGGLRIRSGAHLNEEDSLFLYVGESPKPVRAKVVWVRKEGLIEKRRTGKTGQAYLAGCRLKGASAPTKSKGDARRVDSSEMTARVFRWALMAGGLGFAGALVYIVVMLIQLLTSAS